MGCGASSFDVGVVHTVEEVDGFGQGQSATTKEHVCQDAANDFQAVLPCQLPHMLSRRSLESVKSDRSSKSFKDEHPRIIFCHDASKPVSTNSMDSEVVKLLKEVLEATSDEANCKAVEEDHQVPSSSSNALVVEKQTATKSNKHVHFIDELDATEEKHHCPHRLKASKASSVNHSVFEPHWVDSKESKKKLQMMKHNDKLEEVETRQREHAEDRRTYQESQDEKPLARTQEHSSNGAQEEAQLNKACKDEASQRHNHDLQRLEEALAEVQAKLNASMVAMDAQEDDVFLLAHTAQVARPQSRGRYISQPSSSGRQLHQKQLALQALYPREADNVEAPSSGMLASAGAWEAFWYEAGIAVEQPHAFDKDSNYCFQQKQAVLDMQDRPDTREIESLSNSYMDHYKGVHSN